MRLSTKGFTLIELMVAALLMGIAAVGTGSVMRSGLKLWKRSESDMRLQQEARAILDGMAKEFRNAIPLPGTAWVAKDQTIRFAVLQDPYRIRRVLYRMDQDILTCSEQDLAADRRMPEKIVRLSSFPAQLAWEYAYRSYASQTPVRWEKTWKTPETLPGGIRIH